MVGSDTSNIALFSGTRGWSDEDGARRERTNQKLSFDVDISGLWLAYGDQCGTISIFDLQDFNTSHAAEEDVYLTETASIPSTQLYYPSRHFDFPDSTASSSSPERKRRKRNSHPRTATWPSSKSSHPISNPGSPLTSLPPSHPTQSVTTTMTRKAKGSADDPRKADGPHADNDDNPAFLSADDASPYRLLQMKRLTTNPSTVNVEDLQSVSSLRIHFPNVDVDANFALIVSHPSENHHSLRYSLHTQPCTVHLNSASLFASNASALVFLIQLVLRGSHIQYAYQALALNESRADLKAKSRLLLENVPLTFNVAAYLQKGRVDNLRGAGAQVPEDEDWEVEMVSAAVDALDREVDSEEVVHRVTTSLAFLLRLSPAFLTKLKRQLAERPNVRLIVNHMTQVDQRMVARIVIPLQLSASRMHSSPPFSAGWLWLSSAALPGIYAALEYSMASCEWTDQQMLGIHFAYICIQQNWLRPDIISEETSENLKYVERLIDLEIGLGKASTGEFNISNVSVMANIGEDLKRAREEEASASSESLGTHKRQRDQILEQLNGEGEEEAGGEEEEEEAGGDEEGEEEEEEHIEAQKGKGKGKGKGRGRGKGTTTAGKGKGGGKGGGGGGGSNCQRGANRGRAKGKKGKEIQGVEEECAEGEHQDSQQAGAATNQWDIQDKPAPPSPKAMHLLSRLGNLNTTEKTAAIDNLVVAIGDLGRSSNGSPWHMTSSTTLRHPPSLDTCIQNCRRDQIKGNLHSFCRMMNLITLVMVLDKETKTQNLSISEIAFQHEMNYSTLSDWRHRGLKLVHLACGGTLYLIVIIAALGLYEEVTRLADVNSVSTIARILRDPQDDAAGQIVREIIIPCLVQLSQTESLSSLCLVSSHEQGHNMVSFSALKEVDVILESISTKPSLPDHSSYISDGHVYQTQYALKEKVCSLAKDRASWTEVERGKAANAPVAVTIEQLEEFVTSPDRNEKDDVQYIKFSSTTLQGRYLKIQDRELEPIALLLTNMEQALGPKMALISSKLKVLFFKENISDDSRREGFSFLAQHYNMCYNRYAEKGTGAPKDVHPDYLGKQGKSHINFSQRLPHLSKDILDNLEEFGVLVDMLTDIGSFVAEN
ncbi:hypothetical protein H0H93_014029, partial [Arthromyces matolae]